MQSIQDFGKKPAISLLIAGAIMISFSGVWVKLAHVSPTIAGFYRVSFGAVFLLTATLGRREIKWKGCKHLMLAVLCGFFFALDLFLWHTSIHYIGPGLATLLGNFEVFFLAVAGVVFLGERLSLKFLFSILLAIAGLYLIVGLQWDQSGKFYKTGVYIGLATAVAYTGFLLSLRKLQSKQIGVSVFYTLMIVSVTTAIFLGLKAFISGEAFTIPDVQSWLALIALGLLSQVIGWILITNALPRVRASSAGLILLLQPSLSFIWDVLFFARKTSLVNWVGIAIVLYAIYLGITRSSAKRV